MKTSAFMDSVRSFFLSADRIIYSLIGGIYSFIIDLSDNSWIRNQGSISQLAAKIYAFIGIFMLFKITFSIINYIINPDAISDKTKGGTKILINIILTFALIIVTPFGFDLLYEAQDAIIKDDILGKLIFDSGSSQAGTNEIKISNFCNNTVSFSSDLKENGEYIALLTIRPFFQIDKNASTDEINDLINNTNYCYAGTVRELLNEDIVGWPGTGSTSSTGTTTNIYTVDYGILISTVIGIIVLLVMVGYCLDIALRAVKLVFLEIIAPVPIISNIDPTSGKNGMFSKWLKEVGVTWADLFLRLLSLFLGVYLISIFCDSAKIVTGSITLDLLKILGILMFAKKLPDILKNIFNVDFKGNFNLNPLKKFQEQALGGKQIAGVATGLGASYFALANLGNGNNFRERLSNTWQGMKSGFKGGYKNPNTLKGLRSGTEDLRKQMADETKKRRDADRQLKEFDKFENTGRSIIENAKRRAEKDGKIKTTENGQVYDIDDYKMSYFTNSDYAQSYQAVQKAKKDLKSAKDARTLANSNLRMLESTGASRAEIDGAIAKVQAAENSVSKAESVLSNKKERHKIYQQKYTDDARTESAMEEYLNRNPEALRVASVNNNINNNSNTNSSQNRNNSGINNSTEQFNERATGSNDNSTSNNSQSDNSIYEQYHSNDSSYNEEMFHNDVKNAEQKKREMEEIEEQIQVENEKLRDQNLQEADRETIYNNLHKLEKMRDEKSEEYEAIIEDRPDIEDALNKKEEESRINNNKEIERLIDEYSREMEEIKQRLGDKAYNDPRYKFLKTEVQRLISIR